MFKTSKSYSKKASHKREVTGGASGASDYHHIQGSNGGPFVTSPPPSVRNGSVRNEAAYGHRSSSASKTEGKGDYSESHYVRGAGGQMVPINTDRHYDSAAYGGQAFSESSAYETHEHYERKIKKKTRGERDRRANGFSNGSLRKDLDSSKFQGNIDDIISRLTRGIGIVNEKLDLILKRIEDIEARADSMDQSEVKKIVQEIVDDLGALEQPINDLFDDVDILKAQNHPRANDFYRQVYGLHQRRLAYLDRLGKGLLYRLGIYTDSLHRQRADRTISAFESLEEAIRWVRERLERLNNMVFHEDLEALEELFEKHKLDNRDIQDFHQTVKECIARQAEVSAEDSHEYCELLRILESEYQQLRDLSAGRMLDLDSLIAFIRAAQLELIWIHEREDIEVSRNWSDINQLDLPMLQNYYKQLLHEIELREKQFNDVHNQGAALINQRHPANDVIEVYLRSLQNQWDWLLGLTKCLEGHLRDALNLKSFQEEVTVIEEWIKTQTEYLENNYNRTDFTVEEGERWLRELNEIREIIQKYHNILMSLAERSAHISPLWQRGERIRQPMNVTAWCDYKGKDIEIRQGDDCTLLDNSDLLSWSVRGVDGVTAQVPSVVFRIPPPDPQLTNLLARLAAQLDKMRKLWDRKHRMIRYNMMMSTMKSIQGWDLDTFLSYPPEQRDEIIRALNDDVNKLLSEMDPNDPLALRLKEELKKTNDHFLDLLNQSLRGPDPDLSNQFDKAIAELLKKLEEAWKKLNERAAEPVPRNLDDLERLVNDHRAFEDALQALDTDVSNVKELFRQLPNPTPTQRANHDYLNSRWEDLWELSRMYVERLKLLQQVLQGIAEVTDIVRRHEITLSSFDDMPAALDKLRGVHSQLLELNMVLQQQENIIHSLNQNAAKLRQHVARTRLNSSHHPDIDKLEDEVSQLTVRWDNVCSQVAERLKVAEEAQHTQMVYRSQYDEEIQWLDRVENTINSLRRPEQLRPEELQGQLDLLMSEYAQLQEHTATIEDINKQGGKFIRDAKNYDNSLDVFRDNIMNIHGSGIRSEFRRTEPQPKNGAQIVTEELEALNRRFAQLSSVILERRNQLNVLIQNWKRKQQDSFQEKCGDQTVFMTRIMQELQQLPNARSLDLDFGTPDSTSAARIELLKIRENLAQYGADVERAVREADRLCDEGAEMLSPEQFHALKEARQKLRNQYRSMVDYTDILLKRLDVATSLLIEFTKKSTEFQTWMLSKSKSIDSIRQRSGDPSRLNESKREAKVLHDEILANDDLKEISQLASRIGVEVRNYIDELRKQDPNAKHPPLHAEDVQNTVQVMQNNYETLIKDSNLLAQFLNKLRSLSIDYDHHKNEVNQWLSGLEKQVRDNDPTASKDPPEAQLENLLLLSQTAIANQPKIEAVAKVSKELLDATTATEAHDALSRQQKVELDDIENRFNLLDKKLKDNVDFVRSEITNKDGVLQGLDNLKRWLNEAEADSGTTKGLPLILDKLKELKYTDQLKESEVNSQEKVLNDLGKQLEKMKTINPNIVAENSLEGKFDDANNRFTKLRRNRRGFSENLHDVIGLLENLQGKAESLNKKLVKFNDDIDKTEPTDEAGIKELEDELNTLIDQDWNELSELAKKILAIPGVEEEQHVHDVMTGLEKALRRTQTRLADKHNVGNRLTTDKVLFNQKLREINDMLDEVEDELRHQILDISIDDNVLQEQRSICNDIGGQLKTSRTKVDELEKLGTDLIQASGVVQKRKSMDLEANDGIGKVARQVFDVRSRQDDAERALHNLELRINENDEKRQDFEARQQGFIDWLENENNLLEERQKMELDETSLKNTTKDIKSADKRWRDKQPELGELRAMANQLCNLAAYDSRQEEIELIQDNQKKLDSNFDKLEKENTALEIAVATGIVLLNDGNAIEKWINSKKRVLDICNISSNSQVTNNMTLLDVLSGELEDEKSKWNKFNDTAEELKELAKADSFKERVEAKVDDINKKWRDLEDAVKAKIELLNQAKTLGETFDQVEKEIKKSLSEIEHSIDNSAKKQLDSPEKVKSYISMLDSLQAQSTPKQLSDLETIGAEIEQLATDPTFKSDIKNRINAIKTTSDELGRKLESLKKAAVDSQSKGNEILSEYDDAIAWISGIRTTLDHLPSISADQGKLNDQIGKFEDLYKEVLEREGPMMLLKAKLADACNKSSNPEELQHKLRDLTSEWDPLLATIKDKRQKMESVKKLLDELGDVEVEVKNGLTEAENQMENAKQAEKDGEIPDLEPIGDILKGTRPKIDGLFNLVTKIESLAPGADAKKLNRDIENLLSDFDKLAKEYANQSKLSQTRNELRNQFEKAVISAQKFLEGIRTSSGINEGQVKLAKEKLKLLFEELENNWSKQRREVQNAADKLKPFVDASENEEIDDTLVDLDRSYKELSNQLGLVLDEMNQVEGVIGQSSEKGRTLKDEIEDLADRISDLAPIGRDSDVLKKQDLECDELGDEINEKEKGLELLALEWKKHLEEGKVTSNQLLGPQKEMDHSKHKLEQQKKKLAGRKKQIKDVNDVIDKLNENADKIMRDLDSLAADEFFTQPIATELPELRRQQNALKQLKANDIKPITEASNDLISTIKELIRSAEPGVPTKDLEDLLQTLTNKMNELNSAIDERERKIEAAVQGLGSYNDAYKSLLNWIEEIEELVANQKPPSADYKVTKAQLQNHDFQVRLIDDKQPSVDGFLAMIDRVYALAQDEESKKAISAKAEDISTRYNTLVESANHRRHQLVEAATLGEEFSSVVKPLSQWLDSAGKEVQSLTSIPTNKDKLNEQIKAQEALLDVIDSKRDVFDHLYNIYLELSKLVGPEDATELESTIHNLTEKYNDVGMRCKSLGNSLQEMKEGITSFLEDADSLSQWLDVTEAEIGKFGEMSIYPEELIAQSEVLAALVNTVTEQQELVSRVVQDSNELCSHTSGSEAMALQYRIENLRHRYSQISHETEQKISAITEAIPLSEEITAGFKDMNNFIDECETELDQIDQMPLEEQSNIINQIESEMPAMRQELDTLNEKSMQLQHLSSKAKADELAKWTNDINKQFNTLHDKVIRKADALNLAEKNSRKVFDDLDYSIDWFHEAYEKILTSDKPAIDTERLKTQLKNQRMMNDDIATERATLREIIAAASKVARELKSTLSGQEIILSNKIEAAKKLAEDTAELGRDRLAELEQAFALCSELDDSYTEITEWLNQKDVELRSCEPINTGMSPEQLMEHKQHNDLMLQAYRDQKPIIMKFERNVTTLAELCSPDDANNLREIATTTVERFREQEEEFRQRGRILDKTIEQSNGFGDRLNTFLSNLESANNKIRNPEPVSTRPPLIKRQITDNAEVISLFNQKEDAFRSMKDDANAILAQSTPGDPAATEVAQKINALDSLWFEIQDGLDRRQSFLQDTLAKAERFWSELENCQQAISNLKRNLDSIQLTAADPQKLEENQLILNNVGQGIVETTPAITSLRNAGENLAANVAEDEKQHVEHQVMGIENEWATVTAIYAQMSNNLVDAISKSMNFHELLRQLLIWLTQEEQKVFSLPPLPSNNIEAIHQELAKLEEIRKEIDEQSVLREQLNRAADELYANAHSSQVNAVRAPMNDLNSRWNKLYSLINDRQQKLERALLELGQFEQAYNQLFSWTEKTDKLLNDIQPSCRDLKQIEVELCKLKVIQNDIQSHVPSFDAIMKAGKAMITSDPESAPSTQTKLDHLNDLWISVNKKSEDLWRKLEVSKQEASNRDGEFDRWALWLEDLLNELSYSKPIGGLPETAQSQLEDFQIILADVEEKKPKIEAEIKRLYDQIASNPNNPENQYLQQRYDEIKKNWTRANEKLTDREKKLQIALQDAVALSDSMQEMTRWLDNAENHLSNLGLISRLPEPLEKQMDEHQLFVKNVSAQREVMSDLNTRGTKIQFTCEKKDAIPIKNRLISLKHRFDKVVNRTADKTKHYDNALGESQAYFNAHSELSNFLDRIAQTLKEEEGIANDSVTGDRLRGILEENKELIEELSSKKPLYESTEKRGKSLQDYAPTIEKPEIHKLNTDLADKWKKANSNALKRQRSIEDALVQSGKFDEALEEAFKWLSSKLPTLEAEVASGNCQGDLDTLTQVSNDHQELIQEVKRRKNGIDQLKNRATKILEGSETSDKEKGEIERKINQLNDEWGRLDKACSEKEKQLKDGLGNAIDLDEMLQDLNMKAAEAESKLKRIGTLLPDDETEVQELLEELKTFGDHIDENQKPEVEKALQLGKKMQENIHPKAEAPLKGILKGLSGRWDNIAQSIADRKEKLNKHLEDLKDHEKKLDDLNEFIGTMESALEFKDAEGDANTLAQVDNLQAEHDLFKQELNEKQPDIDEVVKVARRTASKSESANDNEGNQTSPTSKTSKPLLRGTSKLKILQDKPKKSKRLQKTDQVSDRWKKLWEHTSAYDNKLKARKEYLAEMKRLEGFTFDDWRERYLQWNDTGKARISDLFRKIDTSRTGIIPRESFIKGILNSKFPTTPLEMIKVADEFDKGDGMISAKEFMNALRYDPKKRPPPKTDAEIIHEELRKETQRCTCAHKFPITHLSTTNNNIQYGFGFGSTMKRMVRILRSTVMVRVGGGWEKLDEFLIKHDPCRAASRTNVHIYNIPDNALDEMHAFKTRRSGPQSGTTSLSGSREVLSYVGTPGPISKVQQITEKSMPMSKKSATPKRSTASHHPLGSYSTRRASDFTYGDSKIPRPSPSVSRSSSRQNISSIGTPVTSRPPSRMSEDSDERPPSRIPSIRGAKGVRYQPPGQR